MAKKRENGSNKKDNRPTLDEIRVMPGKYLVVYCEQGGGYGVSSDRRPQFAGDIGLPQIMIEPHEPKIIDLAWLDEPNFIRLYESQSDIRLLRQDTIPSPRSLYELPADLEARITPHRKMTAYQIATTPFEGENAKKILMLINARDSEAEATPGRLSNWEVTEVIPFLNAVQHYEQKLGNRPAILNAIKKRRAEIEDHRRAVTAY